VADLFDMQDEIVSRLANTLNAQLIAAEARRAEYAPHPSSMDVCFQGMAWINKGPSAENLVQARGCFERALALDPVNVEAFIGTASVDAQRGSYFLADDRAARLAAAEEVLSKVLSLAPNHAIAHYLLGQVQIFSNRATQGIAQCERALALDRNLAVAHGLVGAAKYFTGRSEETEAHVQEALRLSPRDMTTYAWLHWASNAKSQLGADEEATALFRRGIDANRNFAAGHFFLAAALGLLGRLDEARTAAQAGLVIDPTFTIRRFRAGVSSDNAAYLAGRERMYDGSARREYRKDKSRTVDVRLRKIRAPRASGHVRSAQRVGAGRQRRRGRAARIHDRRTGAAAGDGRGIERRPKVRARVPIRQQQHRGGGGRVLGAHSQNRRDG
jgi:Tfp pilus assembly protein PilF